LKIKIPKIIRPLKLADYAPEYEEAVLDVWVNPPSDVTDGINVVIRRTNEAFEALKAAKTDEEAKRLRDELDTLGTQMAELFSRVWSQGKDPERHMSLDDITALVEECDQNGEPIYSWMTGESWRMILEHRVGIKKN